MDSNLDTNIKGLHCLGDSSGWTRGLMMASVMGVLMGRSWLRRKAAETPFCTSCAEYLVPDASPHSAEGHFCAFCGKTVQDTKIGRKSQISVQP